MGVVRNDRAIRGTLGSAANLNPCATLSLLTYAITVLRRRFRALLAKFALRTGLRITQYFDPVTWVVSRMIQVLDLYSLPNKSLRACNMASISFALLEEMAQMSLCVSESLIALSVAK
jgi:hypothetical protein